MISFARNAEGERSMFEYADEVWVSATVHGPVEEIAAFKELLKLEETDDPFDGSCVSFEEVLRGQRPPPHGPCKSTFSTAWPMEAWNFSDREIDTAGFYSFKFDTNYRFPNELFCALARVWPRLSFQCNAIGSMDEFMGAGWYNGPVGTAPYSEKEVPDDYWSLGFS